MTVMKNKENNNCNIIYKVENIFNGNVYIGATSKDIETRKKDHFKNSKNGKSYDFQDAIATYGPEAFIWNEIDTASSNDELARKEKEYIKVYNSKENGYNSDSGGGIKKTIYQYSTEDGSLIAKFDCLQSAANAVNASKSAVGYACQGISKTCKGYYWSYKSDFFSTDSVFGVCTDNRVKRVFQYNLDGTFIKQFNSVSKASKETGCNKTSLAKVCRGERKSCGGYRWRYC